MIRIIQSQSVQQAKNYYTMGLKQEGSRTGEYYSQEKESVGQWRGLGAERLGLRGSIDQKSFEALCENRNPQSGKPLTPRTQKARRVGYDFNFHCPKSVSVAHALTGDERILKVFQDSVAETMREVEADALTRVRLKGAESDRNTGNLVWGDFTHFTARPVEGKPDPHLHAHCFVFNATWDGVENRWKAAQFGNIKRDARYYEAVFHSRLSRKVSDLGYSVRRDKGFWEIEGVPESVMAKFSRRTALIEKVSKDKGITDPQAKAALGAKTRSKKIPLTAGDLKSEWMTRLNPEEQKALAALANGVRHGDHSPQLITPKTALDYATEHSFEKLSVIPQRELLEVALRHGFGDLEVPALQEEFKRRDFLRREMDGQSCCSTPEILAEEGDCVHFVRDGRGRCFSLKPGPYLFENPNLSDEQKNAVLHVIHSHDRVMAIRGAAGTGKTTMMKEAVTAIEAGGKKVFTFAPSAEASRGVLRKEGFSNAQTVSHLLENTSLHSAVQGQVLWVDEAGLLSVRQMHGIFELADTQKCRVVLAGDTAQHRAVERGDALRLLETHAGIVAASLSVNRRQQYQRHREAVALLRQGQAREGLSQLDQLKAIAEIPEDAARYRQLAKDYAQALNLKKEVLAVSPTHAEGEEVTTAIRQVLREERKISLKEKPFSTLRDLRWSAAQRKELSRYEPGMVIQFHRDIEEFRSGTQARIVGQNGRGTVFLEGDNGSKQPLALDQSKHFQVFQSQQIHLAVGDKIQVTRNGKTVDGHDLSNGEIVQVKGFTKTGDIRLTNNRVIAKRYGNFTYGYCVTSHASQGKTVDQVFIAQSSHSERASYQEQFYVSASRFRESIRIYTDDQEKLKQAIVKTSRRVSATDMMQGLRLTGPKFTPRQRMWQSVFRAGRERIQSLFKIAPASPTLTEIISKMESVSSPKIKAGIYYAHS